MARRHYLVEGGKLQCDKGTALGEIIVISQQKLKIKGKLKATSADKTLQPPFFGNCALANNSPCSPLLQEWMQTSKKSRMGNKTFLMKDSKIQCSKGGMITVKDVGQTLVGTGKDEPELDKKYPKLQGEIIFANGYLSSSFGGTLNALRDLNPDEPSPDLRRGHNMDENDKTNEQDILLADEVKKANEMSAEEKEIEEEKTKIKVKFPITMCPILPVLFPIYLPLKIKKPVLLKDIPEFTLQENKEVFWGYWNDAKNDLKGSNTFSEYFNAGSHQHFLNGSHGLGSGAAHRLDHGIAQGYHWAKFQWNILPKKEVDATKDNIPYIESYSPAYKPITVVMHSQGNAPGVGFALGAMKYANELGYDKMPLNLIFLGVHQPENLWGEDYSRFVKQKVKHYVADSNFWDSISSLDKLLFRSSAAGATAVVLKNFLSHRKDKNIFKYLNGISELFNPKYHKLRHERGIFEHLKKISDYEALAKRAVQFTFTNDRADIVCRDGDLPKIDSACHPERDTTLYSVEYLVNEVPPYYTETQGKEVIEMQNGGHLVIPPYAVNRRVIKEEGKEKEFWKEYDSIAKDWGNAMSTYRKEKKEYQELSKKKLSWVDLLFPEYFLGRKIYQGVEILELAHKLKKVIFQYARIQIADLYAHFAPVGYIIDTDILKSKKFNDELGQQSIWERIKKVGENKFYRVNYGDDNDIDRITEEEKRKIEKDYINNPKEGQKYLIDTNIADTSYIKNVIKAYVEGDEEAEKKLYKEPTHTDAEMEQLQNMFGSDAIKQIKKQIVEDMLMQQDNTRVVKPKTIIPKK